MLTIETLTTDYEQNPIGIDTSEPGLGWILRAGEGDRNCHQTAYRIIVSGNRELLDQRTGEVWDTGRVESSLSQHIIYAGSPLVSCNRYFWKVKVWDQAGEESDWSETAYWETGLMEDSQWQGSWITAPFLKDPIPEPDLLNGIPVIWGADHPSSNAEETSMSGGGASVKEAAIRYFRLSFTLGNEWTEAKLHIYAADSNYIYVNGQSEGLYFPYEQTVTLDIAEQLQFGDNVVACSADGEKKGFVAILHLTLADGRNLQYSTEAQEWKVYHRYEDGWNQAGFSDSHWRAPIQIGRFGHEDWARYKRIVYPVNKGYGPNPKFGKSFMVRPGVSRARLYISSLGIYQCRLNDELISRDAFAPGWTDYRIRIPYQTYDVTGSLQAGHNRLEAMVGSGWYAGLLGIFGPYHYGSKVACRAELHIRYLDGSTEIHFTGEDWQTAESPVLSADFFMGETYDARIELQSPVWRNAILLDTVPNGRMTAAVGPAIRPVRELIPESIKRIGESIYQLNMGQNMVGRIRLEVSGPQGSQVRIRYAERLTPEGRLYTANLRSAKQADTYILKGTADEAYEPTFTYHGFQYIEIEGYPGELSIDNVTGIVIHSDLEEVGEMTTSHPLVNRLLDNIRWSQRGNFIGLPLDCPQRDERLGWTGDAHAFARTATYNMNSAGFYTKWLTDIRDAQRGDGAYPNVAPDVRDLGAGFVFFGDGGVIIPWTMYQVYGDKRFIEANYASMKKWIAFLLTDCDEQLVRRTETFGDHLAYGAETPKGLINAAFFAYSVKLMAAMAGAIGAERDADEYSDLFMRLKESFRKRFVLEDGSVVSGTQTAYVLALMIGLLPEATIPAAVSRLKDEIERNDWHLTTGFMGVSYILAVLSEHGEQDTALRLLLQETFPSWLYPVRNGATTMWERWDGWNEEKGFQDPEMNSFNHYALGSVGEWLYRYLAGIDLAEGVSGFQRFLIRPVIGGGFTHVACRYKSLYGCIGSEWRQEANVRTMNVEIPVNTTAEIVVPAKPGDSIMINDCPVGEGQVESAVELGALQEAGRTVHAAFDSGWTALKRSREALHVRAGSGQYQIKVYKGDNP